MYKWAWTIGKRTDKTYGFNEVQLHHGAFLSETLGPKALHLQMNHAHIMVKNKPPIVGSIGETKPLVNSTRKSTVVN